MWRSSSRGSSTSRDGWELCHLGRGGGTRCGTRRYGPRSPHGQRAMGAGFRFGGHRPRPGGPAASSPTRRNTASRSPRCTAATPIPARITLSSARLRSNSASASTPAARTSRRAGQDQAGGAAAAVNTDSTVTGQRLASWASRAPHDNTASSRCGETTATGEPVPAIPCSKRVSWSAIRFTSSQDFLPRQTLGDSRQALSEPCQR